MREAGLETDYFRLRAYPFNEAVGAFIDAHDRVYVIEQNRDAQMLGLLRQELSADRIGKLRKVLHYNGLPLDARTLTTDILSQEGPHPAVRADEREETGALGGE